MIIDQNDALALALTNQGTRPAGAGDVISHTLYDTVKFALGWNQKVEFFAVPQNGIQFGITKTFGHTNMTEAKKLPAGNRFVFDSIAVNVIQSSGTGANANQTPDTAADYAKKLHALNHLLNYTVLRVKLPTLEFEYETPMSAWLSTFPMVSYDAAAATMPRESSKGEFLSQKVLKLGQVVTLANIDSSPTQFSIDVMPDQNIASVTDALSVLANDGDALRVSLLGKLVRSK